MKRHFAVEGKSECGRGKAVTENVHYVTCSLCKNKPHFGAAFIAMEAKREADFAAQTPRRVHNVWDWQQFYTCRECGGDLWRERPRSLHSYHYVCEGCGTSIHPPTETGMCQ